MYVKLYTLHVGYRRSQHAKTICKNMKDYDYLICIYTYIYMRVKAEIYVCM
jgi:hypothetical protein